MTLRPLQVGVADIRRHLGSRRPAVVRTHLADLAISTAGVPSDATLVVDLALESIADGIVAEGTVEAPWVGECRRCLQPVEGVVTVAVREIFQKHPVEGETYPLDDDEVVDLEPMVRDAVLLSLPIAPLCRPDCPGPAPETFPAGVGESADGPADEAGRDPRWAALDQLRLDDAP